MINRIKVPLIILLILTVIAFRDYSWHELAEGTVDKSWIKYDEKEDFSLWRFWTWFKPPKGELLYYSSEVVSNENIVIVPVQFLIKNAILFKREKGYYCFNCIDTTQVYADSQESLIEVLQNVDKWWNINWTDKEPEFEIGFFCDKFESTFSYDALGYKVYLNPYLDSSRYHLDSLHISLKSIPYIINESPYDLSLTDKDSVQSFIERKHPNHEIIIDSISYQYSIMDYGFPSDVYNVSYSHDDSLKDLSGSFLKLLRRTSTSSEFIEIYR